MKAKLLAIIAKAQSILASLKAFDWKAFGFGATAGYLLHIIIKLLS